MERREGGFTLVEVAVTLSIVAILALAGGVWLLGSRPGALAQTAKDFDAALNDARTLAQAGGNGATLVFARRPDGRNGFLLRVYRGRPSPGGRVEPTTAMPVDSDAGVSEASLGAPPFSFFFGAQGQTAAKAGYPQFDVRGDPVFETIARQPPCPDGGYRLKFRLARIFVTRTIGCGASPPPGPRFPNPSPTPNAPVVTPPNAVYHWPADVSQRLIATEWGYAHWFASAVGFRCGNGTARFPDVLPSPYSRPYDPSEAQQPPSPPPDVPFSYPNAHGGSMNDAPAPFPLQPNAAGLCRATIVDDFGQSAAAAVQVMGWLSVRYRGATFVHDSKPLLHLPAFGRAGSRVTLAVSKTYDSEPLRPAVAFDAACSPYVSFAITPGETPRSPSQRPATATIRMTLVTLPASPIACGGTIFDQYRGSLEGEGVAFNASIGEQPCPNARNAWSGPRDRSCDDLYVIPTGTTETGGWIEESEIGFYVAHGTPGVDIYDWIVQDGTCALQQRSGTDFASWTVLLGNGDPTPPPVPSPAPIDNPAGFDLTYMPRTIAVTLAPDPKPTMPPSLQCHAPPTPTPKP